MVAAQNTCAHSSCAPVQVMSAGVLGSGPAFLKLPGRCLISLAALVIAPTVAPWRSKSSARLQCSHSRITDANCEQFSNSSGFNKNELAPR
jgi:hypothetical protein